MKQKPSWRGIVKIQRPLATNAPLSEPHILIYNEDRTIIYRAYYDRMFKKLFGKEYKIYRYAHIETDETVIRLDGPAPEQEW